MPWVPLILADVLSGGTGGMPRHCRPLTEAHKDASLEYRISFKEALNGAVRRGLARRTAPETPYRLPTYSLGVQPSIDLDKATSLAAELEDDAIAAKLNSSSQVDDTSAFPDR